MHTTMKKLYQTPATMIVELNGGALCQSLIIGSGNSDSGTGDGTDLVKQDVTSTTRDSYNVWGDDWSK